MKIYALVILFFSTFLWRCSIDQPSWEKWRGADATNVVKGAEWNPEALDSSRIVWSKNLGYGHGAITVSDGNCYFSDWKADTITSDTSGISTIYCCDLQTGDEVWHFEYMSLNRSYPGPRSTPIIDHDFLFQLSWGGILYCLDKNTGEKQWDVDLYADSLAAMDVWGYAPSPVIYNDLLLLNLGRSGIALNKNSGKVVWKSNKEGGTFASTTLFDHEGMTLGSFMSDSTTYLVDVSNGDVKFTHQNISTKSMSNDMMLTSDGKLYFSNELVEFKDGTLNSLWQNDSLGSFFQAGVVMGNFAYQFSNPRNSKCNLVCINLESGQLMWKEKYPMWGALTGVEDHLIVIDGLGKMNIINANPDAYQIVASCQVLPGKRKKENFCWTIPTFVDGKILVRNSGNTLVCIDIKE